MMSAGRLVALYPFLFAAVRVLHVADEHPGYFTIGGLLGTLAGTLLLVGVLYGLLALLLRGRADPALPPLLTLLGVLALFAREPLRALGLRGFFGPEQLALLVGGGALVGLAVRWLARRPGTLRTVGVFLTLTGTLLALRFAAGIALDRFRAAESVERSAVARTLARPIPGPATVPGPAPDVYLLVLDEYANAAVLREVFGYDNRSFLDSLRALGFHVPAVVRSNYAHTILSLPSLLNAAQLDDLERELPAGFADPTILNHILHRSRVARYLQDRGYRFVFFPSFWWGATRTSPLADSVVRVSGGGDLLGFATRSELRRALLGQSLLHYVVRDHEADGEHVRRTLQAFARLPAEDAPVFGVAHVLSPHHPYVFDADCRMVRGPSGRPEQRRASYLGQLECVNRMVLGVVTRLLRESEVPPIILLQGDHGTSMLGYHQAPSPERVSAAASRERFGAFGAYYLPGGAAAALGDTVTVVNVLGEVLRRRFGARLPPEPDALYLSLEQAPFDFLRVDPAGLDRVRATPPGTRRAEAHR